MLVSIISTQIFPLPSIHTAVCCCKLPALLGVSVNTLRRRPLCNAVILQRHLWDWQTYLYLVNNQKCKYLELLNQEFWQAWGGAFWHEVLIWHTWGLEFYPAFLKKRRKYFRGVGLTSLLERVFTATHIVSHSLGSYWWSYRCRDVTQCLTLCSN